MLRRNETAVINTEHYLFDSRYHQIHNYLSSIACTELQVDKDGHCMLASMSIAIGLEYRYLADLITDEIGQHRETLVYSPWTVIATIALTVL